MNTLRIRITAPGWAFGLRGSATPAFSRGRYHVKLDGDTTTRAFEAGEFEVVTARRVTGDWQPIETAPENILVETMTDYGRGDGVENVRELRRSGRLWFVKDSSMCVYYTPTHWRERSWT